MEVKHQAGNQVTPLSDIHCASFDVWVRDLGYHKVPALSPRCIWHSGTMHNLMRCINRHYLSILRIPYTRHVSNAEVRRTTCCSPLSHLVTNRHLQLVGHIARSSPREDHHRALAVVIRQVPPDWKRPAGRPSHTWLRAIEADLGTLNFGLTTAWRKATTRDEWRHIVDTATLQRSTLWKKEECVCLLVFFQIWLDCHTVIKNICICDAFVRGACACVCVHVIICCMYQHSAW